MWILGLPLASAATGANQSPHSHRVLMAVATSAEGNKASGYPRAAHSQYRNKSYALCHAMYYVLLSRAVLLSWRTLITTAPHPTSFQHGSRSLLLSGYYLSWPLTGASGPLLSIASQVINDRMSPHRQKKTRCHSEKQTPDVLILEKRQQFGEVPPNGEWLTVGRYVLVVIEKKLRGWWDVFPVANMLAIQMWGLESNCLHRGGMCLWSQCWWDSHRQIPAALWPSGLAASVSSKCNERPCLKDCIGCGR